MVFDRREMHGLNTERGYYPYWGHVTDLLADIDELDALALVLEPLACIATAHNIFGKAASHAVSLCRRLRMSCPNRGGHQRQAHGCRHQCHRKLLLHAGSCSGTEAGGQFHSPVHGGTTPILSLDHNQRERQRPLRGTKSGVHGSWGSRHCAMYSGHTSWLRYSSLTRSRKATS